MADTFTIPTGKEVLYALAHPWWSSGIILYVRQTAYARARKLYESWTQEGGEGDAFRHAYAAALLSRYLDEEEAKVITDLHEDRSDNPASSKEMDLHNNQVGIDIYLEQKANDGREPSEKDLSDAVQEAVRTNRMIVLKRKR